MSAGALRIGVAGLGTVGAGLLKLVEERPRFAPVGREVVVTGVSARSRKRPRPVDIETLPWFDDPAALAASPDNDLFVELIGGSDGPATPMRKAPALIAAPRPGRFRARR
jgi:homoserine dehydrogenase